MIQLTCYHCQKNLRIADKVGFREECPSCRSDVHVCKNCLFYDAKVYNECRENSADVVREKDRANFCEYFQVRNPDLKTERSKADELRAAAEALFASPVDRNKKPS